MTTLGTTRTQVVMDYEDLMRAFEEFADKVADKVKAAAPAPAGDDDQELLTPREVAALFSVTNKTLHVWNKSGFLPRIRIGGVVRYRRADIERAAQVKNR